MPTSKIRADSAAIDFAAIRTRLGIPDGFPAEVLAEAERAATLPIDRLPGATPTAARRDERDLAYVTVDPPGATDLDQALHIESRGDGFRVRYAIADVAAFVRPGGALDGESRARGVTLYSPDRRTLLYPAALSEGAASLLPGAERPAVTWTIDLDARGEPLHVDVARTVVASRVQFDYRTVQQAADLGNLHPSIALLPRVGRLRMQAARRRHAIDLNLPDAEVVPDGDGRWTLRRRATLPVEKYNAQISLLTGMCAARIMVRGKVGILRTLPPPDRAQITQLRHATEVLGIGWPAGRPPGDIVSDLDASKPREAAFIEDAIALLRGAGYTAFDGTPPAQDRHGGLAAPYAHVTAPLRRLVDRFATEVCLSLGGGEPAPDSVRDALPELPGLMAAAGRTASQLDRECVDAVSTFLLAGRVGQVLTGMVVQLDRRRNRATVLLDQPPVRVRSAADGFTEGSRAAVRVVAMDRENGRAVIEPVR